MGIKEQIVGRLRRFIEDPKNAFTEESIISANALRVLGSGTFDDIFVEVESRHASEIASLKAELNRYTTRVHTLEQRISSACDALVRP